jgi:glycyl-tRNA synthetase beta chain
MPDLLFEIGTEELPSWYVDQGRVALTDGIVAALQDVGLPFSRAVSFATPRRLAVRVEGLPEATERQTVKRRGPSAQVAFDEDGTPTKAAVGFCRGLGVDPGALKVESTDRGDYVVVELAVGGERTAEVLPERLASLVRELPAPRKMRWGSGELAFVRPVSWLLALLDGDVLPVEVNGLQAGRVTHGHRFMAPGAIELSDPSAYEDRLREAFVVAEPAERRERLLAELTEVAAQDGLEPVEDEALLSEVVNLVEWPVAILGRFDARYLALPDEVLSTVMIHHQRYVPLRSAAGDLADRFVGISNTAVSDASAVRAGYEAVLDGRLYDARFFWDADRSQTLAQHAWDLAGIAFQKGLGTVEDKVARVRGVAPLVGRSVGLSDGSMTALEAALPLFKADLATGMVDELPELEGVMARAYALEEGLQPAAAAALEDAVKPKVAGGPLPTSEAGTVISACDRLDTLLGFFALGKRPSGSADPFGLRRAASGLARVLTAQAWDVSLRDLVSMVAEGYADSEVDLNDDVRLEVETFVWDRVASLLADEGVGVTAVRAATAGTPPVVLAARRAHLLTALAASPAFEALQALYKRAANLGSQAPSGVAPDPSRFAEAEEAELLRALPGAADGVEAVMASLERLMPGWDVGQGVTFDVNQVEGLDAVLSVKEPLDRFLDDVLVMVDDVKVRENRLALLRAVSDTLSALGAIDEAVASAN